MKGQEDMQEEKENVRLGRGTCSLLDWTGNSLRLSGW